MVTGRCVFTPFILQRSSPVHDLAGVTENVEQGGCESADAVGGVDEHGVLRLGQWVGVVDGPGCDPGLRPLRVERIAPCNPDRARLA